jgi:hypothetical protein
MKRWAALVFLLTAWTGVQAFECDTVPNKKPKKEPKVHPYSFSVRTLKGKIPLDDRYKKFTTDFGFDTRYSWIVDKDAAWYGFHAGFKIRRVTKVGFAYYWTGGIKKNEVKEWDFPVVTARFGMPYYGGYFERTLILQKKAEWSLGCLMGKGRLMSAYLPVSGGEEVRKNYPFHFAEVFSNGTIRVTYFFSISGGIGYRFVLNQPQPLYVKKWIEAPFATFSVQWSFVRMLMGIVDKNIREVY